MSCLVIATWKFSLRGVESADAMLKQGGTALDAVEEVAKSVEDDPEVDSVGFGGFPNRDGEVELDAAFMDGRDLSIGGVAGIKDFRHPVSIARKVMTDTPHNFLVGKGAEDFAAENGFEKRRMLTDDMKLAWKKRRRALEEKDKAPFGHDTVGIVALDANGDMAAATSTSGMSMKLPGRVGDSPLVGSGFYVDNEVGGAVATGVGEDIMKGCTCYQIVELMRQGITPQKAAEDVVRRVHKRLAKTNDKVGNMAVVCADNKGNYGAACNHGGFEFTVACDSTVPKIFKVVPLSDL